MTNTLTKAAQDLLKILLEIVLAFFRGILSVVRFFTGSKQHQIEAETNNEAAAREADHQRAADVLAKAARLQAQSEAEKAKPYSGPLLSIQSVHLGATKVRIVAVDLGQKQHDFEVEIGVNGRIHPRATWPVGFMSIFGTIEDETQRYLTFRNVVEAINDEVEKQRQARKAQRKAQDVNDFDPDPVQESHTRMFLK